LVRFKRIKMKKYKVWKGHRKRVRS
jgi:hypothetical protein